MGKTPLSSAFENSVNNFLNDYNQKLEIALEKSKAKIEERLKEIIDDITERYYNGYFPHIYIRQHQLYGTTPPHAEIQDIGEGYRVQSYFLDDDEGYGSQKLDHSTFSVNVTYKTKKGKVTKKYTYSGKNVDEQRIFEEYKQGVHHRVGRKGSPVVEKLAQIELDKFCQGEMREIIDNELKKIT